MKMDIDRSCQRDHSGLGILGEFLIFCPKTYWNVVLFMFSLVLEIFDPTFPFQVQTPCGQGWFVA